ncbi:Arginine--tRNA ligase [Frankliniella fusca]|uniref:Arginine--tRNA ligase n=1 Tax=Frankliniella fusca TaxID=407009 RepID=A0AAE1H3M6_9NEOP|nr:Arginine--tRNA ligase [Frankliniella fusca]
MARKVMDCVPLAPEEVDGLLGSLASGNPQCRVLIQSLRSGGFTMELHNPGCNIDYFIPSNYKGADENAVRADVCAQRDVVLGDLYQKYGGPEYDPMRWIDLDVLDSHERRRYLRFCKRFSIHTEKVALLDEYARLHEFDSDFDEDEDAEEAQMDATPAEPAVEQVPP